MKNKITLVYESNIQNVPLGKIEAKMNKLNFVKKIKDITGYGLREAKNFTVVFFEKSYNTFETDVNVSDVSEIFSVFIDVKTINDTYNERIEKLNQMLTVLTLKSHSDVSQPNIYFSCVETKEIDTHTGICYIKGVDTTNNQTEIYFSLHNYTIIC